MKVTEQLFLVQGSSTDFWVLNEILKCDHSSNFDFPVELFGSHYLYSVYKKD